MTCATAVVLGLVLNVLVYNVLSVIVACYDYYCSLYTQLNCCDSRLVVP